VSTVRLAHLVRDLADDTLTGAVERAADRFFAAARRAIHAAAGPDSDRVELPAEALAAGASREAWLALDTALDDAAAATERAANATEDEADAEAGHALVRRIHHLRDDLALLAERAAPDHVYWGEARGAAVFLRASPVEVADILADRVLGDAPVVLTSATLTSAGSFGFVRERLGLTAELADELALESPFDYGRQAMLYVARDLPLPREDGFTAAACSRIAPRTVRAVARDRQRHGPFQTSFHLRQGLDRHRTPLQPIEPSEKDQTHGPLRVARRLPDCAGLERRHVLGQMMDALGVQAVAQVFAAHVRGECHDPLVPVQEVAPFRLPPEIPGERHRVEAATAPRIEVQEARRSEHTGARRHRRQARRLAAADAGAVVRVRHQRRRCDLEKAPLDRGIDEAVHEEYRGPPLTKSPHRLLQPTGRCAPGRHACRQRQWHAIPRLVALRPERHLVAGSAKRRENGGDIRFDAARVTPAPVDTGDSHRVGRHAGTPGVSALSRWGTSNSD
jgi:hypothetical protein